MVIYDGLHYDALAQAGALTILHSCRANVSRILQAAALTILHSCRASVLRILPCMVLHKIWVLGLGFRVL